jgi:hypothetical protein
MSFSVKLSMSVMSAGRKKLTENTEIKLMEEHRVDYQKKATC